MSHLFVKKSVPFALYEVRLSKANDGELLEVSKEMGIGLSLEEMRCCRDYFAKLGRDPTDVELQTIGQTWSEHCFHKTFKGNVVSPSGDLLVSNMLKSYIAKVTEDLQPPWCVSVFKDNAGIVDLDGRYVVAIKVETHNHPSAIEPFGGAATGTGGVIRDILGVWAKPIACTDVLCFGPIDYPHDRLPQGVKHPSYLFRGVVAGIGHYGNNMGIPTVNGAILFDEGYTGNVVVYCGCVGVMPKERYVRKAKPGDIVVLAGNRTGRDGIHGVTFASAELAEVSEEKWRPAVQIPDPIEEEKLKRAILRIGERRLGASVTDLGGGGLSCAVCELAHTLNCGVHVELDGVPLRVLGLAPWEIWLSESQERMLIIVPKESLEEVLGIFEEEDVEATPIGRFVEDRTVTVMYRGYTVARMDLNFLFNPPRVKRIADWRKVTIPEPSFNEPSDYEATLLEVLSSPNVASKELVVRTYDHEVQGNTVLKPLQGKYAGPNDAAVLKPVDDSWMGIALSCGIKPSYGKIDPYWMAASSIDEAIRNNVAVGGRRIALLDNFTWGNPEKPDRMGGLLRAAKACHDIATLFECPFISGKDSLYNESSLGPVTPTLLITALGIIPDVRKCVSVDLKGPGNPVYVVGGTYRELGGSEYYRLRGFLGESVPKVRIEAKTIMSAMTKVVDAGCVKASHDLSEGGLAVAAAEMVLSSDYGLELHLDKLPLFNVNRNDFVLFSESNSRFLVEVNAESSRSFERIMANVPFARVGRVVKEGRLRIYGLNGDALVEVGSKELREAWRSALVGLL
jgi:phosphoribosylformylglycinamidine synthase